MQPCKSQISVTWCLCDNIYFSNSARSNVTHKIFESKCINTGPSVSSNILYCQDLENGFSQCARLTPTSTILFRTEE